MAEIDLNRFAALINRKMAADGLTQRQAAAAAGVGLRPFNSAVHARRIGAGNVLTICGWLEIDPFTLLDVPGAPPEKVSRLTRSETPGAVHG